MSADQVNAEIEMETVDIAPDYRSFLAWVLMVMFIVLPPIGTGMILGTTGIGLLGSIGSGMLIAGITSGIATLVLGSN